MKKHLGENKGVEVKAGNLLATRSGRVQQHFECCTDGAIDGEPLQGCVEGRLWSLGQAKVPFSVRSLMDGRGISRMTQL